MNKKIWILICIGCFLIGDLEATIRFQLEAKKLAKKNEDSLQPLRVQAMHRFINRIAADDGYVDEALAEFIQDVKFIDVLQKDREANDS